VALPGINAAVNGGQIFLKIKKKSIAKVKDLNLP